MNGSHIAPLLGGPIGQFLGWRWCFKFAAILNGFMLVTILFCLLETLYVRKEGEFEVETRQISRIRVSRKMFLGSLRLWSTYPELKLHWNQLVFPTLKMTQYPSVMFPALYYATQYGFASILPALTVASIFNRQFGWNTLQIGLAYGASLTIGGSLGELAAGMVLDAIVKRKVRQMDDNAPQPEGRLKAIWTGQVLVPAGLLIYGFTMQYRTHWMGPLMGMGELLFY